MGAETQVLLQVMATGLITVLSVVGGTAWLSRKLTATREDLKDDFAAESIEWDTAYLVEVNSRLDTVINRLFKLEVGLATLNERASRINAIICDMLEDPLLLGRLGRPKAGQRKILGDPKVLHLYLMS